jgi:hypothetical protein
LSVVLALAAVALWVRGYSSDASFEYFNCRKAGDGWGDWAQWRLGGHAGRGAVIVSWARARFSIDPPTVDRAEELSVREERVFNAWPDGHPYPPPAEGASFAVAGFGYRPDAPWGGLGCTDGVGALLVPGGRDRIPPGRPGPRVVETSAARAGRSVRRVRVRPSRDTRPLPGMWRGRAARSAA